MSGLRVPMLGQDNPAKEVDLEVLGSTMFDLEVLHPSGDDVCAS